ncbi:MAG: hypothetical protein V4574_07295 [Pseudomonadota bacterium]
MPDKVLKLTDALRAEYNQLFQSCVVRQEHQGEIEAAVNKMIAGKARYQAFAATVKVPWTLIAVIHHLEGGQSFAKHLHNGDPLAAKTVQVPKNRPPGNPPWTWEESAADALTIEGYTKWTDWSVAGTLFKLEAYNGTGYRLYHPSVLSPYLWSYTNHYTMGKYKADGVWSPTLVSKQIGTAALLRRLAERGEIAFADQPAPGPMPLVVSYMKSRPTDPVLIARAIALQEWLTTHSGVFVKPDGWAGENTSNAYKLVTGTHLPDDPRGP